MKSGKLDGDVKGRHWNVESVADIPDWIFLGALKALCLGGPPCDWTRFVTHSPESNEFPFPVEYKTQKDAVPGGGCPGSQLIWEYLTLTMPRHYGPGLKGVWFEDDISPGFDKLFPWTHKINCNHASLYTLFTS